MIEALTYVLRQVISSNLDLFYFLALILLIKSLIKKERIIINVIAWMYFFIIYSLIQMLLINIKFNEIRYLVGIGKLILNIFLLYYIKNNIKKINFLNITNWIIKIYGILLVFSLIFRNSNLWRLNDEVNKFNTIRLRLFYYEPSELGFQVGIVLIFFIVKWHINRKLNKQDKIYILILVILLGLSLPYGAILSLIIAFIPVLFNKFKKLSYKSIIFSMVTLMSLILIISYNFKAIENTSIYKRGITILSGDDGSTNYRIETGMNVAKNALINTDGLGVGLTNANTEKFISEYSQYGLVEVIANSFMYLITEMGSLGIIFIVFLFYKCIKSSKNNKSILKLSLTLYIFSYQIAGGYFTNPVNWILYGIILSNIRDEEVFRKEEK